MKSDNVKLKAGFKLLFFVFTFSFLVFNLAAPAPASAQLTLAPECDPALAPTAKPSEKGPPCGIPAFMDWIKKIVRFLLTIAIPLGIIFITYGAFVIMTAGGSEEKVKKGRDVITASVIGIAIAFGAWLIVTTVIRVLLGGI